MKYDIRIKQDTSNNYDLVIIYEILIYYINKKY